MTHNVIRGVTAIAFTNKSVNCLCDFFKSVTSFHNVIPPKLGIENKIKYQVQPVGRIVSDCITPCYILSSEHVYLHEMQ